MRLIIKQRILALGMQYRVFDNTDTMIYEIRSDLLSLDRRKKVQDARGNLLGWVKWPVFGEDATFCVGSAGAHLVISHFNWKPDWQMQLDDGQFYSLIGNYYHTGFILVGDEGASVATFNYRATFSDSYVLELDEQALPIPYTLLLVALIDHEYHSLSRRHPWP